MLIQERHDQILHILEEEGRVKSRELEKRFGVGFDTIRRDLRILEGKGLLKRTHGGAILLASVGHYVPKNYTPRDMKVIKANYLAIAEAMIKQLVAGDVIYLTSASIGYIMAERLPKDLPLTIVTNSTIIADVLRSYDEITTIMLGGSVDHRGRTRCSFAQRMVKEMHFDKAIITASACSKTFGISIGNGGNIALLRTIIEQSRKVYGLFPHEKMGRESAFAIADMASIDCLITDNETCEEDLEGMNDLGVSVLVVKVGEKI